MKIAYDNKDFFNLVKVSLLENQNVSFVVKGTSMHPFLKNGITEVFIKKKNKYRKHDICLFEYNGKVLLHRIVKIHNKVRFKGDNSLSFEEVNSNDIIGYVYKYQNNNKIIYTNSLLYIFRVRVFLLYKKIKKTIKKILN